MKRIIFAFLYIFFASCAEEIGSNDKPFVVAKDYWGDHSLIISVAAKPDEDFSSFYLIGQSDENAIFASDGILNCDVRSGGIRFVDASMATGSIVPKQNGIVNIKICKDDMGVVNDRLLFVNGHPITSTTDKVGEDTFSFKLGNPEAGNAGISVVEKTDGPTSFVVSITTTSSNVLGVLSSYTKKVTDDPQLLADLGFISAWQSITYTVVGAGYLSVGVFDPSGNAKVIDCAMDVGEQLFATVSGKINLLDKCHENRLQLRIDETGDSWTVGSVSVIFKNKNTNTSNGTDPAEPITDDTVNPGSGSIELNPTQIAINFSIVGEKEITVTELHCWNYANPTPAHDPIFYSWENIITEGKNYVLTNGAMMQCNAKLHNGQWLVVKSGIKFDPGIIKISLPDIGVSFLLDSTLLWIDNGMSGGNLGFVVYCKEPQITMANNCSLLTVGGVVIY